MATHEGHKHPTQHRRPKISPFRASSPLSTLLDELGPLRELPGTWSGHGFNLIARPDFEGGNDIFLELNETHERLHFDLIGGPIPNRGTAQDDIELFGVHYLQRIDDANTHGALHIEPGLWINVPATTAPAGAPSVVRLASIPHGNAVLAQGSAATAASGPTIGPANTVPFPIGGPPPPPGTPNGFPEYDLSNTNPGVVQFRTNPVPPQITQTALTDPNSILTSAIVGQAIIETVQLDISTASIGGVENIPFLVSNANAAAMTATFWIEKVKRPSGHGHFLQLQYSQTVLLNFLGLSWPHVSVATLVKQ
jgi:hypothetical protein